jgi:hypothetical protein
VEAFFVFLKIAIIGSFAFIALVLVLLAIPQRRLKSTLSELLAWCGFLGASGLIASPVDLIPDMLPVIGWTDDLGYALLALVCGSSGWKQRRRRLTGQSAGRPFPLPFLTQREADQHNAPPLEPSVAGRPCVGAVRGRGRERTRADACQSPANSVHTFQDTGVRLP